MMKFTGDHWRSLEKKKKTMKGRKKKSDKEEEEEETTCWICLDEESYDDNLIVYCDGCELSVHEKCYMLNSIPKGAFYCRNCVARRKNKIKKSEKNKKRTSPKISTSSSKAREEISIYFLEVLSFIRQAGIDYGFPKLATDAEAMYDAFCVTREKSAIEEEEDWTSKIILLRDVHVTILRGIGEVRVEKRRWIRALRDTLTRCSSSEDNNNLATQFFKDQVPLCEWNEDMRAFLGFRKEEENEESENNEEERENRGVEIEDEETDEWIERTYFALSETQRAWMALLACNFLCEKSEYLRQLFHSRRYDDGVGGAGSSLRMSNVGTDARGRSVHFLDAGGGHFWILRAQDLVAGDEEDDTDMRGRRIERVFDVEGEDVSFGGFVVDIDRDRDDDKAYQVLYDDGDVERFALVELSRCLVEDDATSSSPAFDNNAIFGTGKTMAMTIVCDSEASTRAYAASLETTGDVSELRLWYFLRTRAIPKYERAEELKRSLQVKQKRLRKALGLSASHFAMIQHDILASHMSHLNEEEEVAAGWHVHGTRPALADLNRGKRKANKKKRRGKKRNEPPRRQIRRSRRARVEVDYSNAEYDEKIDRAIRGGA